jgi:hypothetical protein
MNSEQNEALRRAALEVLAARHPVAMPSRAIRRRIETEQLVDFRFEDEALLSALSFLEDSDYLSLSLDSLGSTAYWRATAAGKLAFERGEINQA